MFLPNNFTTIVVSISLTKRCQIRSEKSMDGVPLTLDHTTSPSVNSKSSPSKMSKPKEFIDLEGPLFNNLSF